jgi:hypothetical protein
VNKVQRYYYVNGKRVGDVGSDGFSRTDYAQAMASRGTSKSDYKNWKPVSSADFDQNYEPISPIYPGAVPSTYTIKSGETLQSIAQAVWGDASMWYLIADANGLASDTVLVAGQMLTIPNKVTNIHNNSGTFRVYNPGEAIGDVNPTLPTAPPPPKPKKKGGCGGFAMIIVAVVAVVAAAYLGPLVAGALGAAQGGTAAVMISAGVGSIAGQVAGNALGVQQGFDFKSFGIAIATAGIANGVMGNVTAPTSALGKAIQSGFGTSYAAIAARAVVGNVISQGIGNITGAQKGFSWSSVAVAGIGAAAGAAISDKLFGEVNSLGLRTGDYAMKSMGNQFIAQTTAGVIESGVNQLTRIAIQGGKVNWTSIASDTVQAGINAYSSAKGAVGIYMEELQAHPQEINSAITPNILTDDPRMKLRPDDKSPFGGSYNVTALAGVPYGVSEVSSEESLYWANKFYSKTSEQENKLFNTAVNKGGISLKSATESLMGANESDNWQRVTSGLGGMSDDAKALEMAYDLIERSARAVNRLEQARSLNLETLATYTGQRYSLAGLKPYTNGPTLSTWDVGADSRAAYDRLRTDNTIVAAQQSIFAMGLLGMARRAGQDEYHGAEAIVLGNALTDMLAAGARPGYAGIRTPQVSYPHQFDKPYKSKIEGMAQPTGKNDAHQIRTYREVIKYAKDPNVEKVSIDYGYNRSLGLDPKTISPNRRPDVTVLYYDKRVQPIEVQSRSDDPVVLRGRNMFLAPQLKQQGYTQLPPIVLIPTK